MFSDINIKFVRLPTVSADFSWNPVKLEKSWFFVLGFLERLGVKVEKEQFISSTWCWHVSNTGDISRTQWPVVLQCLSAGLNLSRNYLVMQNPAYIFGASCGVWWLNPGPVLEPGVFAWAHRENTHDVLVATAACDYWPPPRLSCGQVLKQTSQPTTCS